MADADFAVTIDYTNHRGERRKRRIRPWKIVFTRNEYHPTTQWLLFAWDQEREGVLRTFAMTNIHEWQA